MLCVLKDMIKSKTILATFIFIIGIAYIGGINNQQLDKSVNDYITVYEMN